MADLHRTIDRSIEIPRSVLYGDTLRQCGGQVPWQATDGHGGPPQPKTRRARMIRP